MNLTLLIEPAEAHATASANPTNWTSTFREVSLEEPALRVGELSTQRGDGIFETIGFVNGHAQEVEPHLDRLLRSAELSDLDEPNRDQWRAAIAWASERLPSTGEYGIRIVLSRGVEAGPAPTAWLVAQPAPNHSAIRANGMRVVTLDRGYSRDVGGTAPWLLLGAKTLSYAVNMAAIREAKRRGASDALFVSSDGYVLEGPTSSLVAKFGNSIVSPRPGSGILHGTTQMSLFEFVAEVGYATDYVDMTLDQLREADAMWLVSSVRLAVPITHLDDVEVPIDSELNAKLNEYLLSPRN